MNKMISVAVASAFLAFTANVNAATLYENDTVKYTVKGDWQVQYRQKVGVDEDAKLEFDDFELKNNITYKLGNGMSAIGQLDFDPKSGTADLEEAYIGLGFANTKILIGKQDTAADEFGLEEMIEDAGISEDAFDEVGFTSGEDVLKIESKLGKTKVVFTHDLEESDGDESATGIFIGTKMGKLALGAAYQTAKDSATAESIKTYGVQGSYKLGATKIFADYSDTKDASTFTNLGTQIKSGKNKYAVGLAQKKSAVGEDITGWYANAVHKMTKNVSLHVEIADNDAPETDLGFVAGMRIKF